MEGGSNGGVGSKTSLTRARCHPVSVHACWPSFAVVHACWPSFAVVHLVHGHLRSFLFVGVRPHAWAFVFVCGRPALFVGVCFSVVCWWWVGGSLWLFVLQPCGGWWHVVCRCGLCDVGPASHVKKRRWGAGAYGTHLHEQ